MPPTHRPELTRDAFAATFGTRPVPYAEARAAGFTRPSLDSALRRGLLTRPRHGLLSLAGLAEADVRTAHLSQVHVALAALGTGVLASFDSSALVHGVARPLASAPELVQLVTPTGAGFTSPGLVVRASPVPERDRGVVDGVPCTSVARTAVDLARGRRLPSALIPLDSAARLLVAAATGTAGNALRRAVRMPEHRAAASDELARALTAEFGWAGTVAVRDALPYVDPASESAAESRSRGWFLQARLGPLSPGTPVRCGPTTYWADFCSPERRVIGEVDGWSKYGESAHEMREAMDRERARQRDLERDGWRVVRWTSLERREPVVSRMSTTLRAS